MSPGTNVGAPSVCLDYLAGFSRGSAVCQLDPGDSFSAEVPAAQAGAISEQLRRPAVVVAATGDIPILGADYHFRGGCKEIRSGPSAASGPSSTTSHQRVLVGLSTPVGCADLGW